MDSLNWQSTGPSFLQNMTKDDKLYTREEPLIVLLSAGTSYRYILPAEFFILPRGDFLRRRAFLNSRMCGDFFLATGDVQLGEDILVGVAVAVGHLGIRNARVKPKDPKFCLIFLQFLSDQQNIEKCKIKAL